MTAAARELSARIAALKPGETVAAIGRCPAPACRTHVRLDVARDDRAAHRLTLNRFVWCVAHRLPLRFARLHVTHDAGVACSSSCWHAVTAECKCSCRGANHGTL